MWQLLRDLRDYRRGWLAGDIAAALTVWAILVPESVAYSGIAGVPPEVGLYVATVPLLVYVIIGSSRRMTVGPSATSAALSAAAIAPIATDAESYLAPLNLEHRDTDLVADDDAFPSFAR